MSEKSIDFQCQDICCKQIQNTESYPICGKKIVINLSDNPIMLSNSMLEKYESSLVCNTTLEDVNNILCFNWMDSVNGNEIESKWARAYDTFLSENLKEIALYHSNKIHQQDVCFYIWYAPENVDCQIHNNHPFKEIHTQLYGMGSMQLFKENNLKSMFHETMMTPGFSHSPFYDKNLTYPWHQYHSYTQCLWLVFEFN